MRGAHEVALMQGYVADAVAMGSLQWEYNEYYWGFHHRDSRSQHLHQERYSEGVFVFEAKATRADFLSTFGSHYGPHENRFKPMGTHHWVVVAKNIIKPEDLPLLAFWGVLEESGTGLKEIHPPYWCNISVEELQRIAYTLLWK